jgi:hypothetical protein
MSHGNEMICQPVALSGYAEWPKVADAVIEAQTMSDNLRRYRAIRDALRQGYPGQPTGLVARHLTTLAALISGLVGSQSTQLPKVATQVPDGAKPESRVKRFARWLDNAHITAERYFVPYAEVMLAHLALQTLVLVIDGSVVGRGCVALMLHVVYKGRALPLAWMVRRGKKGHFPEELHIALIAQVQELIPPGAQGDPRTGGGPAVAQRCRARALLPDATPTGRHLRCLPSETATDWVDHVPGASRLPGGVIRCRDARAPGSRGACPPRALAGRRGGGPRAGPTVPRPGAGPSMEKVLWLTSLWSSVSRMGRPRGMNCIRRGEDERVHGRFLYVSGNVWKCTMVSLPYFKPGSARSGRFRPSYEAAFQLIVISTQYTQSSTAGDPSAFVISFSTPSSSAGTETSNRCIPRSSAVCGFNVRSNSKTLL